MTGTEPSPLNGCFKILIIFYPQYILLYTDGFLFISKCSRQHYWIYTVYSLFIIMIKSSTLQSAVNKTLFCQHHSLWRCCLGFDKDQGWGLKRRQYSAWSCVQLSHQHEAKFNHFHLWCFFYGCSFCCTLHKWKATQAQNNSCVPWKMLTWERTPISYL